MDVEQVKNIFERACLRKKNLTEEQANRIVDIAASEGKLSYFYKCNLCGSFHMTSSEPIPDNQLKVIYS